MSTESGTINETKLAPSELPVALHYRTLHRDPENQRTKYDEEKLQELADSIYEHGIMQNLEARPDGSLTMGNRRHLALESLVLPRIEREMAEAGEDSMRWQNLNARRGLLVMVPVRVLTEGQAERARERQLIENLQREDLSDYDEFRAIADLLSIKDERGVRTYTALSLAERTGLKPERVQAREKAALAPAKMLAAFRDGKIGITHCELVGRIPNEGDRKVAMERILNPKHLTRVLTKDEARAMIAEEFQVSLRGAPFDTAVEDLIPEAGSCSGCRFRSGNMSGIQLQSGVAEGAGTARSAGATAGSATDICTNPSCYRAKAHAAWKQVVDSAEEEGYEVLPQETAKREFTGAGGALDKHSDFVDLEAKPQPRHTGHFREKGLRKWREIVKGMSLRVWKARNPVTLKIVNLVRWSDIQTAMELRKESKGELTEFTGTEEKVAVLASTGDAKAADAAGKAERARREREAREKERAQRELDLKVETASVDAVTDALYRSPGGVLPAWVMSLLFEVLASNYADGAQWLARWLCVPRPFPGASGRDYVKPLRELFEKCQDRMQQSILIVMASMSAGMKNSGVGCVDFGRLAAGLGVDLEAVRKEVIAAEAASGGEESRVTGQESRVTSHGEEEEGGDAVVGMVEATVLRLANTAGSVVVTWGKIRDVIGLPDDDEGTRRAMLVEQEMKRLGMIAKGVLNREAAAVKAILGAPEVVNANVPDAGKSKLAAAAMPSLLGPDNPNAALNEQRLIKLEIAIQTGDLGRVDPSQLNKWASVSTSEHGMRLWNELVSRGVIAADGEVLDMPGWRKDAVGNRRANDYYEATRGLENPPSIPEVEQRFGLKEKALVTYRKNQNRGRK